MDVFPKQSAFLEAANRGNLIPVYTEWIADFTTPVAVYNKLYQPGEPAYLLESLEGDVKLSHYSFIGTAPRKVFRCLPDRTEVRERDGVWETIPNAGEPLTIIEAEMSAYQPVVSESLPRFIGGAVGFLSYEYIHYLEPSVPLNANDPLDMPIAYFVISDKLVIFDHSKQTLRLLVNAYIEGDPQEAYHQAVADLEQLSEKLSCNSTLPPQTLVEVDEAAIPSGNFTPSDFKQAVCSAQDYIRAGDNIQVVLSQRFQKAFDPSPLTLYRALRTVNPSPYMFLFQAEDFSLVGASPELHVRLTDGKAAMRPIAGTRPRGEDSEAEARYAAELHQDDKELAEHLMLVDLARNDLGRVCDFGSVTVPEYLAIEYYSHVMHLVSQVEGKIRPECSAYDLMRATFPAGTVSGAPKIRAMQIIAELEHDRRATYAGALGYFSYDGNLDSCITIRTALIKDGKIYIQAGAGIVADSQPESEFQETINKAKGLFKAVTLAERL